MADKKDSSEVRHDGQLIRPITEGVTKGNIKNTTPGPRPNTPPPPQPSKKK